MPSFSVKNGSYNYYLDYNGYLSRYHNGFRYKYILCGLYIFVILFLNSLVYFLIQGMYNYLRAINYEMWNKSKYWYYVDFFQTLMRLPFMFCVILMLTNGIQNYDRILYVKWFIFMWFVLCMVLYAPVLVFRERMYNIHLFPEQESYICTIFYCNIFNVFFIIHYVVYIFVAPVLAYIVLYPLIFWLGVNKTPDIICKLNSLSNNLTASLIDIDEFDVKYL